MEQIKVLGCIRNNILSALGAIGPRARHRTRKFDTGQVRLFERRGGPDQSHSCSFRWGKCWFKFLKFLIHKIVLKLLSWTEWVKRCCVRISRKLQRPPQTSLCSPNVGAKWVNTVLTRSFPGSKSSSTKEVLSVSCCSVGGREGQKGN